MPKENGGLSMVQVEMELMLSLIIIQTFSGILTSMLLSLEQVKEQLQEAGQALIVHARVFARVSICGKDIIFMVLLM